MKQSFFPTLISIFFLTACGTNQPDNSQAQVSRSDSAAEEMLPPVETEKPNTTYKPAFNGQTRVGGVKTSSPYQVKSIASGLDKPWGIAFLPDGRLLITQKTGTMRIATTDGTLGAPITGIPKVDSRGQGGLQGLAVDPDFVNNRTVYFVFSEPFENGNVASLAKGTLSADDKTMQNVSVIYRATPSYNGDKHYGGRVIVAPDGNLIMSTGERSDLETRPQAQQLNSALGKILRLTKDGKPAAGNPFEGKEGTRPEIYSYGHRNVLGIAFHPVTGELWNNEMGPRGGDEINIIKPGNNYGWPTITYGIEYSGATIGNGQTQMAGMEQPVYYWDPVLSPGGMTFYTGDVVPEWKNNLFIGGLSSKHIARLIINNNKVVGEERLLATEKQRFRDVQQGRDGNLYAITDEGRLYRIGK
ncbi:MAG: PQQ-dependent sugar dehydrogenase [Chitinophagaceae bacterium]|nr:MAG: PQQ-dependent sugar dehydrogenase [Chitinophagaceae bacterium]